jgi:hypothetical protein
VIALPADAQKRETQPESGWLDAGRAPRNTGRAPRDPELGTHDRTHSHPIAAVRETDDSSEIEEVGKRQSRHADLGRTLGEGLGRGRSAQQRERGAGRQLDKAL